MTEISVTVPVYNVEKYLSRCLNTILDQTFPLDYEIICVDDGSTDNSGKILDEYAKRYSKIKVIHQENQGLSVARNTALEQVQGKYTMFIDSDDFIAQNALEGLYNYAQKHGSDVVLMDFYQGDSQGNNAKTFSFGNIIQTYGDRSFNIENAETFVYRFIPVATWAKFYSTDLVKDIKFVKDLNNQDVPHWASVYTKAKSINYLPVPYYFYVIHREESITLIKNRKAFDVFKAFSLTKDILVNAGYFEKFKNIHYAHFTCNLVSLLNKIMPELRTELIELIKNCDLDVDYESFFKDDFFKFEKDNMNTIRYIRDNDFDSSSKMLYQLNIWK